MKKGKKHDICVPATYPSPGKFLTEFVTLKENFSASLPIVIYNDKDIENLKFIRYLKLMPVEKAQSIILDVYNNLSFHFDCRKCANCCKKLDVSLSETDIINLAFGLNIGVENLKNHYLRKRRVKDKNEDSYKGYTFNKKPCPFLKGDFCSCYDYRPEECRQFPHLDDGDYIYRIKAVINCEICPILSTIYEILKSVCGFEFDHPID